MVSGWRKRTARSTRAYSSQREEFYRQVCRDIIPTGTENFLPKTFPRRISITLFEIANALFALDAVKCQGTP